MMGAAGSPEEAGEYRPLEGLSRASGASAVLLEGLCLCYPQKTAPVFVAPQAPGIGGLGHVLINDNS